MNKTLKLGFIVFACLALIFGFIKIKQTIKITNNLGEEESEQYAQVFQDTKSRVTDTDEDGLTDWEEENTYFTSIYLADTDSDGISDFDELSAGGDPNCEEGRVCGSDIIDLVEQAQSEASTTKEETTLSDIYSDFSEESLAGMEAMKNGDIPTASQMRALLIDSGISKDQVDAASDEDLIQLFQEVSTQTEAGSTEQQATE